MDRENNLHLAVYWNMTSLPHPSINYAISSRYRLAGTVLLSFSSLPGTTPWQLTYGLLEPLSRSFFRSFLCSLVAMISIRSTECSRSWAALHQIRGRSVLCCTVLCCAVLSGPVSLIARTRPPVVVFRLYRI